MSGGHGHRHGHGREHEHGHGHAQDGDQGQGPGGGHGHGGHGRHRNFGNPDDLAAYLARLEGPDRAEWQKPDELVRALKLSPGAVVGEVGAGPGYFTLRLARAVGPSGKVIAVEVVPEILAVLQERLAATGVANVSPVLSPGDDPRLPPGACDLVLVVNTFHHFPEEVASLRKLAAALRPGGRLVNVDFHKRELPVGPPPEHKVTREEFLASAAAAGLELVEEHDFLPHQYFLVLRPRR